MPSPAERLLKAIDPLPYPARRRLLAETARRLTGSTELDGLLDELTDGDRFTREVALQLAYVAGHRDHVERALRAPDPAVAGAALRLTVRMSGGAATTGELIAGLLPDLPAASRVILYTAIRRNRASSLADRLLPTVRASYGDVEACGLLPACRSATVSAALPELGYAVANWTTLGGRHPQVVLGYFDAQLSATPRARWAQLWRIAGPGVAAAAAVAPGAVLALLERSVADAPFPVALGASLGALARHDPARVLRIVLDPRRTGTVPGGRSFWRAVLGADDAHLVALARGLGRDLPRFLHVLPPRRRPAVYNGVIAGRDLVAAGVPITVLDELPAAARHAEARRLLGRHSVADDARIRLEVTARLDWAEARRTLLDATRRPIADERAAAYPCYIGCAAATRDPAVFADLLTSLSRLTNEQDPVRCSAIATLATVPPWLFGDVEAPVVTGLMSDAVHARDNSGRTNGAIRQLAVRLIREGAATARPALVDAGLRGLELFGAHLSGLDLHRLDQVLPHGAEHGVFAALQPRMLDDARLGRYTVALALAAGLRRRAWTMPQLQQLVDQARGAKQDGIVRRAIELWLAPPATRDQRVEQILRDDRSTITIAAVRDAVAWRRTDLLDDIFTRRLHGRFLKRGVRYLPDFRNSFAAWLPRQTTAYAELLTALAGQPRTQPYERAAAVRQLGRLPRTVDDVRAFLADREIQVVEAALAALSWSDDPAAVLPELLGYSDGDRARVAVYAATRAARFVTPKVLGEHLRPVLASPKITSRKEAVRLIAQHRVPGAATLLLEAWSAPQQHRDVQRALVSAARWFLADEQAWTLLDGAVADDEVATAVLDLPPDAIAERHRARYASAVRAVAASGDPDNARRGLAALPDWARWGGPASIAMLDHRITDLGSTATWRPALATLIATCAVLADGGALREVAVTLLAATDDPAAADQTVVDRDQPAWQRLAALTRQLAAALPGPLRSAAIQIADLLPPDCAELAVELAAAAVPWEDDAAELPALRHIAALSDGPLLGWLAARRVAAELAGVLHRLDPARVLAVATALAADTPATGLLAVAITRVGGREAGWPPPWRATVRELRRHPDPDVRRGAHDIVCVPE